jgi:putative FmdB family regulatory protein
MPTYEYFCSDCKKNFEISQKIVESPISNCPECHSKDFKRGVGGGSAILRFEGSGFYITDYANQKVSQAPKASCGCGKNSCNR